MTEAQNGAPVEERPEESAADESAPEARAVSSQREALLSALFAVMIWGSFTTIAAVAIEKGVSYLWLGVIVQFGIAIIFAGLALLRWSRLRAFWRRVRRFWPIFLVASLLFPARDIFFLYALSHAPKLSVSVIDALWPIFLVLFANIFIKFDRRDIEPQRLALLGLAFAGAALLILTDGDSVANLDLFTLFSSEDAMPYLIALFGAMAAGGELVSLKYIRERAELEDTVYSSVFLLAIARAPTILYGLGFILFCEEPLELSGGAAPYVAFLILGWVVANIAFTYAVLVTQMKGPGASRVSMANLGSIAYLSPVINVLVLAVVFQDEVVSEYLFFGLTIVVLANFLMNAGSRYADALTGAMVIFMWTGLLTFFEAPLSGDDVSRMSLIAEVSGAVLAIVTSFTLLRMAAAQRAVDSSLSELAGSLEQLLFATRTHPGGGEARPSAVSNAIDELLKTVTLHSLRPGKAEAWIETIHDDLDRLEKTIFEAAMAAGADPAEMMRRLSDVSDKVDAWIMHRRESVSIGEYLVSVFLASLTVIVLFYLRPVGFYADLATAVFAGSLGYLILYIRDVMNNKWRRSFHRILVVERIFKRVRLAPYLPSEILHSTDMPTPKMTRRYRTEAPDATDGEAEVDVQPEPFLLRLILPLLFAAAIAATILLMAAKHDFTFLWFDRLVKPG